MKNVLGCNVFGVVCVSLEQWSYLLLNVHKKEFSSHDKIIISHFAEPFFSPLFL